MSCDKHQEGRRLLAAHWLVGPDATDEEVEEKLEELSRAIARFAEATRPFLAKVAEAVTEATVALVAAAEELGLIQRRRRRWWRFWR